MSKYLKNGYKSKENQKSETRNQIMKTIKSLLLTLIVSLNTSAQVVISSYADVFPATKNRLSDIGNIRKVEDTAVASVASGSGSFATTVTFPEGTTSAIFTVAQHIRSSRINGVETVASPGVVSIAGSKYNPEGDVSLPSLGYVNSADVMVVPVNSNFVGTTLVNPKTVFITEQRVTLPQLQIADDYWQLSRDLSGTYTLNGVVTPFSVTGQTARVVVVNETAAPLTTVTQVYPSPVVTSSTVSASLVNIFATGLTVASYNQTWWMETSTDLIHWNVAPNATVAPGVVISFPVDPLDSKRFYRVASLTP